MIAIIDYGMGNIHSVSKALEFWGAKTQVTNNPQEIAAAEKLVLPGVGAFADAIQELKRQDLIQAIKEHIRKKKIFLGICLGMQLLFASSEEAPKVKGLGILEGKVKKFSFKERLKVPHMGWNQISLKNRDCPIFKNVPDNAYVYFCHSYYPQAQDKKVIAASTSYGIDFTSILWKDNIYGLQFHPEKSQETGLEILKNFVGLC